VPGETDSKHDIQEIVGESRALKQLLAQTARVAASNATALILGEAGSGKELIARAIHRMSPRRKNSFVKVNCSISPESLERTLFGHAMGALTGVPLKVGKLELANQGTLFLDEIAELSLDLQPKLLGVLQNQKFERLGSMRTQQTDVRLIAATKHDLETRAAAHQFCSDLYDLLKPFPIRVPSLRERYTDIPLLVRYFVQKFSGRMGKHIETIPTETMNALLNWSWPGNVRELENLVEQSVILTEGPTLRVLITGWPPSEREPR